MKSARSSSGKRSDAVTTRRSAEPGGAKGRGGGGAGKVGAVVVGDAVGESEGAVVGEAVGTAVA